jgi:branched-subunit amino acid permease
MEFSSFVAAILIFLICLIVALKPSKIITLLGAVLILPLLLLVIYQ